MQIGKIGNYLRGRGSGIRRVLRLGCKQVVIGAWGEKGAGRALVDKGLIVRLSEQELVRNGDWGAQWDGVIRGG